MRKVKRVTDKDDLGGGSGRDGYKSDMFRCTQWFLRKGKTTDINLKGEIFDVMTIRIHGHPNIKSDVDCLSQFTPSEIKTVMKRMVKDGIEKGRKDLQSEYRVLLGMG